MLDSSVVVGRRFRGAPSTRAIIAAVAVSLLAACGAGPEGELPGEGVVVRASDYGDEWPLTVPAGRVACVKPGRSVVFTDSQGTVYAVNGTAKGQKRWREIEPIWKAQGQLADVIPVARLSEAERKAIFSEIVACEDDNREPPMRPGQSLDDFQKEIDRARTRTDACKATIGKRHKLSADERGAVSAEGAAEGWPPLTPTRVSIAPLIDVGLKQCE